MPSARRPCSAIFSRLPVSISTVSSISARVSSSSAAIAGAAAAFNSSSNSTDSPAKLLTKLSGFLISWAMPAVSWPSEAIFSACTRLACAVLSSRKRRFGGVAGGADLCLGALAFGDVAVDQHKAAARHRVAAHLDDPSRPAACARSAFLVGRRDAAGLAPPRCRSASRYSPRSREVCGCNPHKCRRARRETRRAGRASPGNCGSMRRAAARHRTSRRRRPCCRR